MGKKKLSFKEIMTNYGVIIIMVCLIVFTGITRPNFITTNNLTNILATMSFRLVIALGIAGCIITAGCDLSAGRMIGFGGCIADLCSIRSGNRFLYRIPERTAIHFHNGYDGNRLWYLQYLYKCNSSWRICK